MNGWVIAATVIGSWCVLSALVGIFLGHAIAGRPLRHRLVPVDDVTAPVSMLGDAQPANLAGYVSAA